MGFLQLADAEEALKNTPGGEKAAAELRVARQSIGKGADAESGIATLQQQYARVSSALAPDNAEEAEKHVRPAFLLVFVLLYQKRSPNLQVRILQGRKT
jgi:hypothetical protein